MLIEVKINGLKHKIERELAFLDTLSVIKEDGSMKTRVYKKETHTDQFLNFQSNHPFEHKRGVVRTLAYSLKRYRAKTVMSEREDRKKELEYLRGALQSNGYSD